METDLPPLTEALVQDLIYAWCYRAKHEITVPNCGAVWGPEADVASLALDGAWRAGHTAEQVAAGLGDKLTKNEGRDWPDWRTADPDKAIEHNWQSEEA